ncbi:type VI secretion system lipoprotein TssJ [Ideonella sp. DXS29W]|uniref:Type VI secretion system lipoprotein TssJ n=1 Tax=Ideonella lacteola TaxID=2984193 RepID=A0ABU9BVN6_9BURK
MAMLLLSGCGSTQSGGAVDKALDLVGLQRPSTMPAPGSSESASKLAAAPSKVAIRLHAGEVLNTTVDGRSLSVVARIYKLRDRAAFEQASYDGLQDPRGSPNGAAASADWSRDVVDVKEVVLTPGQKFEVVETVPPEAPYVAVVAMFRAPAPQRWRFVFETKSVAQTGLTLGVHACALSVAAGQPVGAAPDALRLAGVRCS